MAYNPKTGKGLGRFYSAEHRAFRAREWRGFRDTFMISSAGSISTASWPRSSAATRS